MLEFTFTLDMSGNACHVCTYSCVMVERRLYIAGNTTLIPYTGKTIVAKRAWENSVYVYASLYINAYMYEQYFVKYIYIYIYTIHFFTF